MQDWPGNTARGIAIAVLSLGGLCAFWTTPSASSAELTPAQIVAYRFPVNWSSPPNRAPVTARQLPSAERGHGVLGNLMFDPSPTYGLASASSTPVALPERANAYADPSTDGSAESKHGANAADRTAKTHSSKSTASVLNDAQIASIKARLRLTSQQERYWPAVEAALRNISYKKDGSQKGLGRLATIDPNSPAVQELKAAAMPLLASFSDEQKSEVRQIARLMGLEQVAQSF
jgi:hypothetical protein